MPTFAAGTGRWAGRSEVYDGEGAFAGYGVDRRTVVPTGEGRIRVEVAFDGPFSFRGAYDIADDGDRRRYLGPLNHGLAEPLGAGTVDARSHWPALGLDQHLLLAVLEGGGVQVSLALLRRGVRHVWAVVGENRRVDDSVPPAPDAGGPPPEGAPGSLLLRPGVWRGDLHLLDARLEADGTVEVEERTAFCTDGSSAWLPAGGAAVGSFSLFGPRAMAGTVLAVGGGPFVEHREVSTTDGSRKAVCRTTFDGGRRTGVAHGTLYFTPDG